ncbi:hypothetical protein MettiDRAFT_1940 [Methanolobus tindarius DSM 2278]|uniref:Uncharacterized protein n=1 Tax=Methanolobus tindarius DSM 2278 TaxID=1090322 RepID=W9DPY3_METTI|nr:hypothetical protein [Methanolobus tindarius]ETA68469.1 hypothetical protein MettiDRAFT_1940 [Methanolobus tindarius DSM 2278]
MPFSKDNNLFLNFSKALYSLTTEHREGNPEAIVEEWSFFPLSPCTGDVLDITGKTEPGETITMAVVFSITVPVSDNRYEHLFDKVGIPGGSNSFQVVAQKVHDLNFIVRMFVDFKRSFDADNGVAQFYEKNVPHGNYEIVINGTAIEGERDVRLDFLATQTIKADEAGNFHQKYDTCTLPEGDFTVKVGNREKVISLSDGNKE